MTDRRAEAANWFARMRGPDAEAKRAAFEAWRADPDNAAAYSRAEENWLITGGVAPEYLEAHRKTSVKTGFSRSHFALAASLLLAISLAFAWIMLGNRGGDPIVAEMATGELIFEDGTRVALMDGARIDSAFSKSERRITLIGGRARFAVAHDASRPFRVVAEGSETTALGTVFEVDLTGPEPVIHLVEGSVEIRATARSAAPLRLRPGQRAIVPAAGPQLVSADTPGQLAMQSPVRGGDVNGLLIADELPLGAVLDRANRVNPAKIEVAGAELASRPVSGRFDVSDAKSLSRKLAAALGLEVEDLGGGYRLKAKIKN